eukprot:SAG22_NODE_16979_length_313_cov_1.392523_1_plen_35_part_10
MASAAGVEGNDGVSCSPAKSLPAPVVSAKTRAKIV